MGDLKKGLNWRFIGHTAAGVRKKGPGIITQNKISCSIPDNGESPSFVLSCAEGVENDRSFRGDRGADCAVEASRDIYKELMEGKDNDATDNKKWTEETIKRGLVDAWQNHVADDIYNETFEMEDLKKVERVEARRQAVLNPIDVYDSQLLNVIGLESTLVFFRIGEGEVIIGFEDNSMDYPIPKWKRNEIFVGKSLSLKNSKDFIEIAFLEFSEIPPPYIFVFSRSLDEHLSEERKADFISSVPRFLIQGDLDGANKKLDENLEEISKDCKEDVSFGLVYRSDILNKGSLYFKKTVDKENEIDKEKDGSKDDYF